MKKEKAKKQGSEKGKSPAVKKLSAKDLKRVYGGGKQAPGCSANVSPCCK